MRLKLVIAVMATAAFAFGAADSFGAKSAKSTVKITEGGPTLFQGTVTSKEPKCEKGRKVSLLYSAGGKDGEVVGTDKTDSKGNWEIPGNYFAGNYHAEVKAKNITAKRGGGPDIFKCLFGVSIEEFFKSPRA